MAKRSDAEYQVSILMTGWHYRQFNELRIFLTSEHCEVLTLEARSLLADMIDGTLKRKRGRPPEPFLQHLVNRHQVTCAVIKYMRENKVSERKACNAVAKQLHKSPALVRSYVQEEKAHWDTVAAEFEVAQEWIKKTAI